MTTLIEVRNSDGVVGRCDAKCYNAENEKCECICGGKNHGQGKAKAVSNTEQYCESMVEKYREQKGFQWESPFKQLSLF